MVILKIQIFMFHLPNIEIADLCLINLTSVSKNRAVIVTKVRSISLKHGKPGPEPGERVMRGLVKKQGHNRTVAS